ncbi:MAG: hypothetical protein QM788_09785 [Roseateles sp.]|uniref:hypothetical protein n=1 Tax=Roseateles sp. TaxID=1971397 RepID=UPI0039EC5B82
MAARLMAFLVWLLLGGSVAYWGLQLLARPLAMPGSVLPVGETRATQVDLGRLLGTSLPQSAPAAEAVASTRLRLLGVVAPKSARAAEAGEGVALIEVDGVPRTVRVGAVVDGDLRLLRVGARSASLGLAGQAPVQVLEIAPPAAPVTGSLPPALPSQVVLGGNPPDTAPPPAAAPVPPEGVAPANPGLPLAGPPPQQQRR